MYICINQLYLCLYQRHKFKPFCSYHFEGTSYLTVDYANYSLF